MFKSFINLYRKSNINNLFYLRTFCSQTKKWDLISSVCLQRRHIISQDLNETEIQFLKFINEIENENSLKSDHELKKIKEKKQETTKDEDSDEIVRQTAQEFEDFSLNELKRFEFSPRKTDADKNNDLRSIERNLDRNLYLILYHQELKTWCLPQSLRQDGETMRQAAERTLKDNCGHLNVKFYGNAPCGFYKYKYPKDRQQNGILGAKVFFYQATYMSGDLKLDNNYNDYKWLTEDELENSLIPEYHKSISNFLITDS